MGHVNSESLLGIELCRVDVHEVIFVDPVLDGEEHEADEGNQRGDGWEEEADCEDHGRVSEGVPEIEVVAVLNDLWW